MDFCMNCTWEEFIEGFKEYVEDYGYEPDEIRPLKNWVRDYIVFRENEYEENLINGGD